MCGYSRAPFGPGACQPTVRVSDMKKDEERCYPLILRYVVFLNRELERKAEMDQDVEENEASVERNAMPLKKIFYVVPLCNTKSHFVTIDSRIFYGVMKEIRSEFDVSR